jgi:hypothetical protein
MAKSDPMLARIRAFDRAKGGGVAVERANKSYFLFSAAVGGVRLAMDCPLGPDGFRPLRGTPPAAAAA